MCIKNNQTEKQGKIVCNLHITHLFQRIQSYLDYPNDVFQNYLDNSKQDIEKLNDYMEKHPDNFAIITANTDDQLFYIDLGIELQSYHIHGINFEFAHFIPTSDKNRFTIFFCKD